MSEYLSWDATEMAALVRAGEVSAAELDAACRARIEQVNPAVNAVAELSAERDARQEPHGSLAGVPFAVKELLPVPGLRWTMGSRLLAETERHDCASGYPPIGLVRTPAGGPLRIGVLSEPLHGGEPDPVVRDALERSSTLCDQLGHRVAPVQAPGIDAEGLSQAFFATAARTVAGLAEALVPLLGRPPGPAEMEPFTLELIDWAATLPTDTEQIAGQSFEAARTAYLRLFDQCDVVLSPTFTRTPWPLGTLNPGLGREELIQRTGELVGYTPIHNIAGCPAMSVPLAWPAGLPVGSHFAAAPGADATFLALAYQLEQAHPWAERHPQQWARQDAWSKS